MTPLAEGNYIEDFGEETLRKKLLGRNRRRWDDNIKTYLK